MRRDRDMKDGHTYNNILLIRMQIYTYAYAYVYTHTSMKGYILSPLKLTNNYLKYNPHEGNTRIFFYFLHFDIIHFYMLHLNNCV